MTKVVLLVLFAGLCVAEPPVANYLPAARGSNGISSQDGVPSSRFGTLSGQYGAPISEVSRGLQTEGPYAESEYSSRSNIPSQQYAVPSGQYRTPSSNYGAPSSDYSSSFARFGTPSNQYGAPDRALTSISSRSGIPSQYSEVSSGYNYEAPATRQFGHQPSPHYASPGSSEAQFTTSRIPESQYDVPSAHSSVPSSQYGTPSAFRLSPSSQYGAPAFASSAQFGELTPSSRTSPSSQYGTPSEFRSDPTSQYGTPSEFRSGLSSQYGTPSTVKSLSPSQFSTPSSQYGTPSSFSSLPSSQYGTPAARTPALSSVYGSPSRFISTSSSQYGTPLSQRSIIPSSQYGTPSSFSGSNSSPHHGLPSTYQRPGSDYTGSNGYSRSHVHDQESYRENAAGNIFGQSYSAVEKGEQYARAFSQADGNDISEPAKYDFSYDVSDGDLGVEFGQEESRDGEDINGSFHVLLPDGRRQRVQYTAGQSGYKPTISYENTGIVAAGRQGQFSNGYYADQQPRLDNQELFGRSAGHGSYDGNNGYESAEDYQNGVGHGSRHSSQTGPY